MEQHMLRLVIICCLFLALAGCDNNKPLPLRVAHNSWPGYEPLPLGEVKNLYTGLNVVNYRVNSATEVVRAFEQDVVDVAAVTLDEAIALQSRTKEVIKIITVLDVSHGGDVIIAEKSIGSIKDLKNKFVGVESSALGAFFISRAADMEPDLSLKQINIKPLLYDQHYTSFISGEVDAIVTFEPVSSKILKNKGHIIFDSTHIENEIIDILIVKQSILNKRTEDIKKLVTGYFDVLEFIKVNQEESFSKMAEFEGVSISSFRKSLSGIRVPGMEENHLFLSGDSPDLIVTINKLQKFMLENKIIENNVNASELISSLGLPKLEKN